MKIGVKVGDVMTRDFVSVNPHISLLDAARVMVKKHVGSLIVEEKDILKGIITDKDIIWALTKKPNHLSKITVGDISKRKVQTIKPNADLYAALKTMQKSKFRRLPVTVNKKIIGLLTLKDILRIEPALFEIAQGHHTLEIREETEKLKRKKNPEEYNLGICEECGNEGLLEKSDGIMLCESCRDSI